MPEINGTTIPGSVALPIWTLVAAIVVLFTVREVERRTWFKRVAEATDALNKSTEVVDALAERVKENSARILALELALAKGGGA